MHRVAGFLAPLFFVLFFFSFAEISGVSSGCDAAGVLEKKKALLLLMLLLFTTGVVVGTTTSGVSFCGDDAIAADGLIWFEERECRNRVILTLFLLLS